MKVAFWLCVIALFVTFVAPDIFPSWVVLVVLVVTTGLGIAWYRESKTPTDPDHVP